MVQKSGKKKNGDDESHDLTRIEDLSEFLHEEDPDLEDRFNNFKVDLKDLDSTGLHDDTPPALPSLPETEENTQSDQDTSFEAAEESLEIGSFESQETEGDEVSFEESSFDFPTESFESSENSEDEEHAFSLPNESSDESSDESSFDSPLEMDSLAGSESTDFSEEIPQEDSFNESLAPYHAFKQEDSPSAPERFEDVKTFAQNFSYGKVQGAGNPPFSIIVRHIKFKEDAEHIEDLLREFDLINDKNEADTRKALEYGSIIIPQISEYCAIVLAHKLRRFDLDIEVGLSDEIHPSKEAEGNPKGLLKKDSLKQNKTESFKLSEVDNSIKDVIVSTSSSIPGHVVSHYIGIQTVFAIVDEAELEKLQFVQKSMREKSALYDYEAAEENGLSSEKAFTDYQNSFTFLYDDLAQQLKQKAFTQKANALLGLNFQLSPLQFERSHKRVNAYQVTCSATLAVIIKEMN